MPEGYEGVKAGANFGSATRIRPPPPRRRRPRGSAMRDSGRGPDREGLGPVRRRRPGRGRGRERRPRRRRRAVDAGSSSRRPRPRSPWPSRPEAPSDGGGPLSSTARLDAATLLTRRLDGPRLRLTNAPTPATRARGRGARLVEMTASAAPDAEPSSASSTAGADAGISKGQPTVQYGDYGLKLLEAGWLDEPPDRGRPYRDDAQDQARRQGLDQRLPGQAVHEEAGRDAHGLWQGLARGLGRRHQAGPRDVRARRRSEPLAKEALRLAGNKLSVRTKVVKREAELFD